MKNRFDTFKTAGWLLDESYDPMNYMTEAEEDEETVAEEEEEEEDLDTEDNDEDLDLDDDTDAGDEDLDLDDDTEGEEEDSDLDPTDIAGRLDAIEDKLDDIADKNEPDEDETFDLDLANPVCPCCGARLNILNTVADTDEIAAEGGDENEENTEDEDISALLAGETPEEDVEGEGEDITTMDDSLDDVDGLGYDDSEYVSLDDDTEDEDED
jgi:E3 ubiquitin-protein ligase HUWE1